MINAIKILVREGLLNEANPEKIADKFGIPIEIVNHLTQEYSKKYWLIILQITIGIMGDSGHKPLKDAFTNEVLGKLKLGRGENLTDKMFEYIHSSHDGFLKLIKFIQVQNRPKIDFKTISSEELQNLAFTQFPYITDWADNPNMETPNLTTMTWDEAIDAAMDWHGNLKASGEAISDEEGEMIHKFEDGYYWFDNGPGPCDDEGEAAGHCGIPYRPEMHMISLRKNRKPAVTLDWDPETKEIIQFEGNASTKPKAKYHPYIIWFLSDPDRAKKLTPELSHQPDNNFHMSDLTDGEKLALYTSNNHLLSSAKIDDLPLALKLKYIKSGHDLTDKQYNVLTDKLKVIYINARVSAGKKLTKKQYAGLSDEDMVSYINNSVNARIMRLDDAQYGVLTEKNKLRYVEDRHKLSEKQLDNTSKEVQLVYFKRYIYEESVNKVMFSRFPDDLKVSYKEKLLKGRDQVPEFMFNFFNDEEIKTYLDGIFVFRGGGPDGEPPKNITVLEDWEYIAASDELKKTWIQRVTRRHFDMWGYQNTLTDKQYKHTPDELKILYITLILTRIIYMKKRGDWGNNNNNGKVETFSKQLYSDASDEQKKRYIDNLKSRENLDKEFLDVTPDNVKRHYYELKSSNGTILTDEEYDELPEPLKATYQLKKSKWESRNKTPHQKEDYKRIWKKYNKWLHKKNATKT